MLKKDRAPVDKPVLTVNFLQEGQGSGGQAQPRPSAFGLKKDKAQKDAPLGPEMKQFHDILALRPTQKLPSRMSTGALSVLKES